MRIVLDPADSWQAAVFKANETSSFEAVVLDKPDTGTSTLEAAVAFRTELKAKLGREARSALCRVSMMIRCQVKTGAVAGSTVAVPKSIAEKGIPRPQVHKENSTVGIYAGRLANQEVSIADSPARVKNRQCKYRSMTRQRIKTANRWSWQPLKLWKWLELQSPRYPDYPGQYWTTGRTLDVPGGDFQDARHIRVAMKAARKVRVRAIARIADREFNSTPGSEASAKPLFH